MRGGDEIKKLARFGLVGIGATLTHIGCVIALSVATAFHPVTINTLAFLAAFLISGLGHAFYTFRIAKDRTKAIAKFFIVAVSALILSNVVLYGMVDVFGMNVNISKGVAIVLVPCFSYVLARFWAFKEAENA